MKKKSTLTILMLSLFAISLASCKSVRKKNKCNSCPTWDHIDLETSTDDNTLNLIEE